MPQYRLSLRYHTERWKEGAGFGVIGVSTNRRRLVAAIFATGGQLRQNAGGALK